MIASELTGKAVPEFDAKIVKFLERREFFGEGAAEMAIAVKNDSNEVYRTIKASGLADFMAIIGLLQRLKLIDLLEDRDDIVDGFDAIFVPRQVAKRKT